MPLMHYREPRLVGVALVAYHVMMVITGLSVLTTPELPLGVGHPGFADDWADISWLSSFCMLGTVGLIFRVLGYRAPDDWRLTMFEGVTIAAASIVMLAAATAEAVSPPGPGHPSWVLVAWFTTTALMCWVAGGTEQSYTLQRLRVVKSTSETKEARAREVAQDPTELADRLEAARRTHPEERPPHGLA